MPQKVRIQNSIDIIKTECYFAMQLILKNVKLLNFTQAKKVYYIKAFFHKKDL
jgi:hypothetical protein